ncbi:MAG: acriflavin resistance protein [Gemmatimonadetes bacterium]|nr:acriflavin resistance protein [Gemmatimonadota bacterium]
MKLFDLLSAQRRFIYLAVALASAVGIWTALTLPSAIYPELLFPRITIVAEGTALGAREVVFAVTRPIEEAVTSVQGVRRVTSRSIRGSSEIQLYFDEQTDMQIALSQTQQRITQAREALPPGIRVDVERLSPSVFPILSYNLEGGDPATLYDLALYQLRPSFSRVSGVGRVDVQGSAVREIEVVADPTRLAALGMSYSDVAQEINHSLTVDAVGRVTRSYSQYLVVADQAIRSADSVGGIVLGNGLRVRDIAAVSVGTTDRVSVIAGDGRPAVLINITRQIGGNTVAIADSISAIVASLSATLPPGTRLVPVYDQASLVRDALTSVRDAMLIGAVLAVIVLLVFLRNGRVTAIAASSIPLTLAITVGIMARLGQTFNLMTLGAMAIAIGLVIDDAIVITENIVRHMRLTHDRAHAVREAMQELIWPVTTSTLTTVVVFAPLSLLTGVVGQFFSALSITLSVAVLVSLVLAITIIPLLAESFLKEAGPEADAAAPPPRSVIGRIGASISGALDGLADRYERSLGATLHHPRALIAGALGLLVVGFLIQRVVGSGFLPEMDEGAFVIDYFTPGGTPLEESDRLVTIAERILASEPEVASTSRRLGAELGLFATEQNRGDIAVRLKSARSRSSQEVIDDVRVKINRAAPRLRIEFVQILSDVINDLAGAAKPIEIKVFGPQLDTLERYATTLSPKLEAVSGVADLFSGVSEPASEMHLQVNSAEASRIGLDPQEVSAEVSSALLGVSAGDVRLEDHTIGVRVRAPDAFRYAPTSLDVLPVHSPVTRGTAPLASIATATPVVSRAEYRRENQQQMIAITADVSSRSLGSVMTDVKRVLAQNPPPPNTRVEIAGQYANQQSSFRALMIVLTLAAVSVVAIMLIQFRSFIEPLLIVLAAPVSFVGAVGLLWVTGTQLNVSSLMGLILLIGLIVKNGIILLDFTELRMRYNGERLEDAIRHAARVRLRPILMTTLCTLAGLIPLALGLGAGSELQKPLAIAVIGGLTLSTPITLYLVPTLLVAIRGRDFRRPAAEAAAG